MSYRYYHYIYPIIDPFSVFTQTFKQPAITIEFNYWNTLPRQQAYYTQPNITWRGSQFFQFSHN